MAKQTINIGASPNDGTGTPLRTAFDYCNLNFTELYTATGPSGNNIVVPGNATITGDLTVDTSTLKVDSANDRVGIGTASPGYLLDVQAATAVAQILSTTGTNAAYLQVSNTGGIFYLGRENSAGTSFASPAYSAVLYAGGAYPLVTTVNGSERYRIASDGVATWSNVGGVAGTAMTLNSTGLGVGASPAHKLQAVGGYVASGKLASASSGDIGGLLMYCSTDNGGRRSWGLKAESGTTGVLGFWLSSANNTEPFSGTQVMSLDASGNLSLANGNLVMTTSGKGIDFSATTSGSGTMTSELLNDYEEGTWNIGLTFGGASTGITANASVGRYTKIGRQVTVSGLLSLTSKGSSTGIAEITGLPFTIANADPAYSAANVRFNGISFADIPICIGAINSTKIIFQEITKAGAVTDLTDADFTNTSSCIIGFTYTV